MLDFYADWCVSCKEMERFTFSDAGVQKKLAGALGQVQSPAVFRVSRKRPLVW